MKMDRLITPQRIKIVKTSYEIGDANQATRFRVLSGDYGNFKRLIQLQRA